MYCTGVLEVFHIRGFFQEGSLKNQQPGRFAGGRVRFVPGTLRRSGLSPTADVRMARPLVITEV